MTQAIQNLEELPGRKVHDQEENPIGKVKEVYARNGDGEAGWLSVEVSSGMAAKRSVLIPLARIKEEDGELVVPYSRERIEQIPEIESADEITAEEERKLRDHFGIDVADQELRADNDSYATLVPDGDGTFQRVKDAGSLKAPDANKVTDETRKRLAEPGSSETRDVTADDVTTDGADSSRGQATEEVRESGTAGGGR